jgi:hypothetical protein
MSRNGVMPDRSGAASGSLPLQGSPAPRGRELEPRPGLSYHSRPVPMPAAFLVLRAFALRPVVRLGWGAIFGPLVW